MLGLAPPISIYFWHIDVELSHSLLLLGPKILWNWHLFDDNSAIAGVGLRARGFVVEPLAFSRSLL